MTRSSEESRGFVEFTLTEEVCPWNGIAIAVDNPVFNEAWKLQVWFFSLKTCHPITRIQTAFNEEDFEVKLLETEDAA